MSDRKHAARLRRQHRQQSERRGMATAIASQPSAACSWAENLAEAVDFLEENALDSGADEDQVGEMASLVRRALGLPAGPSPKERDVAAVNDLYGACPSCGASDWREEVDGAACNRCYPIRDEATP